MKLIAFFIIGGFIANAPFVFTTSELMASTSTERKSSNVDAMHKSEEVQKECCLFLRLRCATKSKLCCCLKMRKKDRYLLEAAEEVEKEFHVTHLIKQLRTMEGILREKLTDEEWKEAQAKYSLKHLEQDFIDTVKKEFVNEVPSESDREQEMMNMNKDAPDSVVDAPVAQNIHYQHIQRNVIVPDEEEKGASIVSNGLQ